MLDAVQHTSTSNPPIPPHSLKMIPILGRLETLGIAFDSSALSGHQDRATSRLRAIAYRAMTLTGGLELNLSSAAQLAKVLYQDLGLPVPPSAGEIKKGISPRHCSKEDLQELYQKEDIQLP
jgi:DNA polymerase I-like protein with 3'-5' exonuclease and polymerase domains